MKCLFLDIASHNGSIALVGDSIVQYKEFDTRLRDHELIPLVEKVLEDAKWNYDDLTHVACVIGPGGFTSLRIAVSFANTLIDQLEIQAVGIHLSDLYKKRASSALWLHATKKEEVFIQGPGWNETTLITMEEARKSIPQGSEWTGELLDDQIASFSALDLRPAALLPLQEILPKFLQDQQYSTKPLTPWYGRSY